MVCCLLCNICIPCSKKHRAGAIYERTILVVGDSSYALWYTYSTYNTGSWYVMILRYYTPFSLDIYDTLWHIFHCGDTKSFIIFDSLLFDMISLQVLYKYLDHLTQKHRIRYDLVSILKILGLALTFHPPVIADGIFLSFLLDRNWNHISHLSFLD